MTNQTYATKTILARDLETGMRVKSWRHGETKLITRVSRTSAGIDMRVEFEGYVPEYYSPYATVEIA